MSQNKQEVDDQISIEEGLNRAYAHWNAGQAAHAEQLCMRVLQVLPQQPAALHLLGLMAHAYGKLDMAIDHLRRACLTHGVPATYLSNLAEMYRQKGLLAEAEQAGQRAVARADIVGGLELTVLVSDHAQYKVRLASIDAPEKNQNFGMTSKQALSDCAYGKLATIEGNKDDRYGRLVGKVIVAGTDCNLRQIKLGLAWHYKKYQNEQDVEDRSKYAHEEYVAQSGKRRLWHGREPIPPWDYRKLKREVKLQASP